MRFLKLLFGCLTINNFLVCSVLASSDINYCDYLLSLTPPQNNSACSNLPFVSPFNDSRTNLILLTDSLKVQKATLGVLASPQSKAPYILSQIRGNIASIPFELTIYDGYLDELAKTKQIKLEQVENNLDNATKRFVKQVKNVYQSKQATTEKVDDKQDFLVSPALTYLVQLVKAKELTEQERLNLGIARYALFDNTEADIGYYISSTPSATARPFVSYLLGTEAFYKTNYSLANKFFSEASQTSSPWIKETATYMIARTLLNQGQAVAYNNWGELSLDKVDQTFITNSRVAFNNYLLKYPKGLYAHSSRALLRRIYWLQDNKIALANTYESLLESPQSTYSIADLILEIDNKIYFNGKSVTADNLVQTPKLLTVYDLLKMRTNKLTLSNLKAQQVDFEHNPRLYNYLLASYYTYLDPQPQQVIRLIPELVTDTREFDPLAFSEQVLRALALEAENKWDEAAQLWLSLKNIAKVPYQPQLIELGLALNYEKSGHIAKAFVKGSAITTPQLRYILLRQNADRKLLIQLATDEVIAPTDRAAIVYLLLYKDLLSTQYDDFLTDNELLIANGQLDTIKIFNISKLGQANLELFSNPIPSHREYACPSPIILANILKLNATDAKALNCLGEFSEYYQLPYSNYIPNTSSLNNPIKTGALGTNNPTDFGKILYSRLAGYQRVINDDEAGDDDKAYALYKAIRCFAGSGYNRCDKQNIAKTERKKWFLLLHSKYSKTLWARQQDVYW